MGQGTRVSSPATAGPVTQVRGREQVTVFNRPVPASGTSGEGKSVVQLLVVYYKREQYEQRVEREFQQRQREQQQQDEQQLCYCRAWRLVIPRYGPSGLLRMNGPDLYSFEKLWRHYRQCRRNKRNTANALAFELNAEENLLALQE